MAAAEASDKKGFIAEFKEFIATGNMIELAVAVILGAAVGVAIKAFTDGIIMQVVAAIFGKPNFDDVTITLRHDVGPDPDNPGEQLDAVLRIGTFINALISLILTGLVLFMIIKAYNRMKNRNRVADAEGPASPTELELLTEIRDLLRGQNAQS